MRLFLVIFFIAPVFLIPALLALGIWRVFKNIFYRAPVAPAIVLPNIDNTGTVTIDH